MTNPGLRRARSARVLAALLVLAAACAGAPGSAQRSPEGARSAGARLVLRDHPWVGQVWRPGSAALESEETLLSELPDERFVLLGEVHDNPVHHRLQARAIRRLVAEGRRPAVVLEMLSADVAPELAALAARPDPRPADLRRAVAWDESGWPPWELYAPIFEPALEADLPLVAGDLGREVLAAVRRRGLAGLDPGTRTALALEAPVPEAWREILATRIREGHCNLLPEEALPRMVEVQLVRDAHLARALDAAAAAGGEGAVLVAGAGHVRRDAGVPEWLARRGTGGSVASVALVEVQAEVRNPEELPDLFDGGTRGGAPYDWVWFTPRHPREDPCAALRRAFGDPPDRAIRAPGEAPKGGAPKGRGGADPGS